MIKKISIVTTILFNLFSAELNDISRELNNIAEGNYKIGINAEKLNTTSIEFDKEYLKIEATLNNTRSKINLTAGYVYQIDINDIYSNYVKKSYKKLNFDDFDDSEDIKDKNEIYVILFNLITPKIPIVNLCGNIIIKINNVNKEVINLMSSLGVSELIREVLSKNPELKKNVDNLFFAKNWEKIEKKNWQGIWLKDSEEYKGKDGEGYSKEIFEKIILDKIYKNSEFIKIIKTILNKFYLYFTSTIINYSYDTDYQILNYYFNTININENKYKISLEKYFNKYFENTNWDDILFPNYHNHIIETLYSIITLKKASLEETKKVFLEETDKFILNIFTDKNIDNNYKISLVKKLSKYKKQVKNFNNESDSVFIAAYRFACNKINSRIEMSIKTQSNTKKMLKKQIK